MYDLRHSPSEQEANVSVQFLSHLKALLEPFEFFPCIPVIIVAVIKYFGNVSRIFLLLT